MNDEDDLPSIGCFTSIMGVPASGVGVGSTACVIWNSDENGNAKPFCVVFISESMIAEAVLYML